MELYTKWVACWGNATSFSDQTAARYAKNLTLRYPIRMCFNGKALRFRFSNLTGSEPVTLRANVAKAVSLKGIDPDTIFILSMQGDARMTIQPGCEIETDEVRFPVKAGEIISVSIYLEGCTQMNAGTLITGPLSGGYYSYGNFAEAPEVPLGLTRNTNWYYFLNTVDVLTEEKNHALICYGDSITAQDWPDELALRCAQEGYENVSIIRRAVSGTRILRQYGCITYAAYGLQGSIRFPIEANTAGADIVIVQHGINDIIHPVGEEVNPFRPWSDLPTAQEMIDGVREIYIRHAREKDLKIWGGTLLPIYGWRTYAPFRNDLRCEYNAWLRTTKELDGCIDFDAALRDSKKPEMFAEGYDSGDHLHPSSSAYRRMAAEIPAELLK